MTKLFKNVINDMRGVSALEYGLMAALIAGALVTSVSGLATDLNDLFVGLGTQIQDHTP